MFEEINMNEDNGEEPSVFENIDCYDAFNLAVIMRSDTNIGKRERTSYLLIGCERSEKYRVYKKDLLQTMIAIENVGIPLSCERNQWWEVNGG